MNEVEELDNTLPSTIATKTEGQITRHGIPETILTDNGAQFIATDYKRLCQKYQIQHSTSSPYWPQGNGKLEASVKMVKWILKNLVNPTYTNLSCTETPPPPTKSVTKGHGMPYTWTASYQTNEPKPNTINTPRLSEHCLDWKSVISSMPNRHPSTSLVHGCIVLEQPYPPPDRISWRPHWAH